MPHVIEPFKNVTFEEALLSLREAHRFLVSRAKAAITASELDEYHWGASVKRLPVKLNYDNVPNLIGKTEEKLVEVINIAATVERLIDGIEWFAAQPENQGYFILECHPSTSDESSGNDLVMIDGNNRVTIRCEVFDVVSLNAGSNNKEKKDIQNLGCNESVPKDGVKRYICTALEFGRALTSPNRRWESKPYRYKLIETGSSSKTCMLLISAADDNERVK
ncbi:MAG TPA: hypothetical protein VMU29_14080 [Smithella sp.]|nr:hypothetical protein [Smithella sp.]